MARDLCTFTKSSLHTQLPTEYAILQRIAYQIKLNAETVRVKKRGFAKHESGLTCTRAAETCSQDAKIIVDVQEVSKVSEFDVVCALP